MGHKFLLTTTILLISLINLSPRTLAGTEILDTDGNPLVSGSRYYILTSGWGAAGRGGVTPTIRSSSGVPCPKYVAQFSSEWEKGRPVSFFPSDPNQKEITEETEVNISFGLDPYCRNSMVWQLNFEDSGVGSYIPFITTNGVIGNPGAETFNNWFQIEKIDKFGSYRILYCFLLPVPYSDKQGKEGKSCEQIDATIPGRNGLNYLSLVPIENSLPFFGFVFKKVEEDVITASV
ncbi:miraculin-like [Amaranthus tricolor]|uniref:miraculin-like n=1 Tax=Amaranthus tricolor TaxID=29722 RepID=UPI00258FD6C2|nr:miraculin-like [Amaranthus tricolor]